MLPLSYQPLVLSSEEMPTGRVIKGIYGPVVTGQHSEHCSLMEFRPHLVFELGKGIQEPLLYTKQDSSDHPVGSI